MDAKNLTRLIRLKYASDGNNTTSSKSNNTNDLLMLLNRRIFALGARTNQNAESNWKAAT
jgi:hypothetical protein